MSTDTEIDMELVEGMHLKAFAAATSEDDTAWDDCEAKAHALMIQEYTQDLERTNETLRSLPERVQELACTCDAGEAKAEGDPAMVDGIIAFRDLEICRYNLERLKRHLNLIELDYWRGIYSAAAAGDVVEANKLADLLQSYRDSLAKHGLGNL